MVRLNPVKNLGGGKPTRDSTALDTLIVVYTGRVRPQGHRPKGVLWASDAFFLTDNGEMIE